MALTAKERKKLTAIGQTLEPIFQIGKNGLSSMQIEEIGKALDTREIVKISILQNSDENINDVMEMLCEKLKAEPVSKVGRKLVIYRYSNKKNVKHIEF